MYFNRIRNKLSFDKFRPNFHKLYNEVIFDKKTLKSYFSSSNHYRNNWNNLNNKYELIPVQNTNNNSNTASSFHKYRTKLKYFAYFAGTSYVLCNSNEESDPKNEKDDDFPDNMSTLSTESDSSTTDPFDDDDVVYYYKNYSYESPSKDNKYYYEIKRYRYPNSKSDKLQDSLDSDIESLFSNHFYNYYKRIKDHFNGVVDNITPIVYSNGEENNKKMEPFWLVLTNTPPTTFSNAFIIVCGTIFAMWKLAENSVNTKISDFMTKHFLASYEAIKAKRYHTLLTSAISHSSFIHFGLNCMFFHQLMKTFHNNMGMFSGPLVNNNLQSFVRSIFGPNNVFDPGVKMKQYKHGRVSTNDIFNVLILSGIISSLGHVLVYKTPVLGASGAISGLMYLLAATFPNSYFKTVFPLPGLNLSILQIGQMFVATNLYFLATGNRSNIAWAAHLIGMGAGALYCFFQQYVNNRPGFYNPISLSLKTAKSQWKRTMQGIKLS